MQIIICGADSSQVTAIRDAIEAMTVGRNDISLNSTYAAHTKVGPKTEILIILMHDQESDGKKMSSLEELRRAIENKLLLGFNQVVCATKWR